MPRYRTAYPPEFRRHMVDLVRSGRTPEELALEFDPIVRGRLYGLGKRRLVSSEKARRMFDWTPRPATETVLDTARSLQAGDLL